MSKLTKPTSTVALLFWLMLVVSLAGVSLLRLDALDQVVALWIGTLVGVGGGQLVAKLRIRAWVFGALAMVALWSAPVFFFMIYDSVRTAAEICVLAAAPAFACGYFSLSERWGLASFWYPAMLWMLVVLDGGGSFDAIASLPLLIGLGAMFMAFFRARETRRVALWQSYGLTRLAKPVGRQVLRASPARAASQWIFTALVGSGALALTALIAPHLWQKEQAKEAAARTAAAVALSDWYAAQGEGGGVPCCKQDELATQSHVKEYVALTKNTTDSERRAATLSAMSCRSCPAPSTAPSSASSVDDPEVGGGGYVWNRTGHNPTSGGGSGSGYGNYGTYGNGGYAGAGNTYVPPSIPPTPAVPVEEVVPTTATTDPLQAHQPTAAPVHAGLGASPYELPLRPVNDPIVTAHTYDGTTPAMHGAYAPYTPKTRYAPRDEDNDTNIPWGTAIAFGLAGFGAHLMMRVARRQLRLRHLARPFWPSSIDQRVSNLWERMLIGLRDAGIQPRTGEQPQALAKRVGLPGMETCATILERVRHGVRLEQADLDSMQAASSSAFVAARAKAGVIARAAAIVRPLA